MPSATPSQPLSALAGPSRRSLHLLYHELTPEPTTYGYALTVGAFRDHLQVATKVRDRPDWFIPEITFDDGHESNYTLAFPLLEELQIRAHFFITAGWTSTRPGYMTADQLRQLHRHGHRVGAHGWSHRLLTHCSPAELEAELVRTRGTLEDWLGAEVTTLSLPGGRGDARVLSACAKAGYSQVFTSVPAAALANAPFPGRLNVRAGVTSGALEQWLEPSTGALDRITRQYRLKAMGKRVLGDALYARLWALLNRAPSAVAMEQP